MEKIRRLFKKLTQEELVYENLMEIVHDLDVRAIDYEPYLPQITHENKYARNILMMEPLEVAVLHWPPGVGSAVHYHDGFWGFVMVLEGEMENTQYRLNGDKLSDQHSMKGIRGAVINEPEGVIHKISNCSANHPLVTLHIYYPALKSLEGMRIYDLEKGTIGVLSKDADTASFQEPEEHFLKLEKNAFTYQPVEKAKNAPSHRIYSIIPKPEPDRIKNMISNYYGEQAASYDSFDIKHPSRQAYNTRINEWIAEEFCRLTPRQVLAMACGTGRRANKIKELSGINYQLFGVDMSEQMSEIARRRGIISTCGEWCEMEFSENIFDAATCLYAFGHLTSYDERLLALQKTASVLKKSGVLFLDVFNAEDHNEWGPKAVRFYQNNNLQNFGYEKGDVFYKKTGGKTISFLHYFTKGELLELLEEAGFEVAYIRHIGYVHRPGELLREQDGGAMFVKAVKR